MKLTNLLASVLSFTATITVSAFLGMHSCVALANTPDGLVLQGMDPWLQENVDRPGNLILSDLGDHEIDRQMAQTGETGRNIFLLELRSRCESMLVRQSHLPHVSRAAALGTHEGCLALTADFYVNSHPANWFLAHEALNTMVADENEMGLTLDRARYSQDLATTALFAWIKYENAQIDNGTQTEYTHALIDDTHRYSAEFSPNFERQPLSGIDFHTMIAEYAAEIVAWYDQSAPEATAGKLSYTTFAQEQINRATHLWNDRLVSEFETANAHDLILSADHLRLAETTFCKAGLAQGAPIQKPVLLPSTVGDRLGSVGRPMYEAYARSYAKLWDPSTGICVQH